MRNREIDPAAAVVNGRLEGLLKGSRYVITLYGVRLLALVKSAVLAGVLGPSGYGVLSAFATFLAYTAFLDLGLFHAMNREVPMMRGAGERESALRVIRATRAGSLLSGCAGGVVILAYSALQAAGAVGGEWWISFLLACAVALQTIAGMLHSLCYAEQRFDLQANAMTASTGFDVAFSLFGGILFGVPGALSGFLAGPIAQWLVLRSGLEPIRPLWDFRLIRTLSTLGIPIGLVWVANTNLVGLDKIVILSALGSTQLGLYSIASVAGALVVVGPTAVSQLVNPRVLEKIGAQEHLGSLELVRRTQEVSGLVGGTVAAVGIAAVPGAVVFALPEYIEAIPSAQVLMIASAVFGLVHPLVGYFVAHRKQLEIAAWYFGFGAFNVILDLVLLSRGFGLLGVAFGSLATYVLAYVSLQIRTNRLGVARGTGNLVHPILFACVPVFGGFLGILAPLRFPMISGSIGTALSVLLALVGALVSGIWMAWRYKVLPGRSGGASR